MALPSTEDNISLVKPVLHCGKMLTNLKHMKKFNEKRKEHADVYTPVTLAKPPALARLVCKGKQSNIGSQTRPRLTSATKFISLVPA